MKTRPIMFNAEMVRAVLDGRKTQTRRPVRFTDAGHVKEPGGHRRWHPGDPEAWNACPLGVPGDRLWARERARVVASFLGQVQVRYEADGARSEWVSYPPRLKPVAIGQCIPNGCFREASRITLEVTGVRVERVRDILHAHAVAEGVGGHGASWRDYSGSSTGPAHNDDGTLMNAKASFKTLWDSIYSSRGLGWDANPWVWAVDFCKVDK